MRPEITLGLSSFALCLISTPVCRGISLRLGIVDRPDGTRKLHTSPVPRVGGIAIAFSYAMALTLLLFFAPNGMSMLLRHKALLLAVLPPACIIFVTGLIDDLAGLKPLAKLAGQAVGAALAVALGARITLIAGSPVSPWITLPLSFFWLLACTNALNLIDGLDGLATGVGLFATLTTVLAAILQGNSGLIVATVPLACCLLAFLVYNFHPASVFLGDCGSLTIGFLLGSFALVWSQRSPTLLGMTAPLMVLALPLLDVGLAIGRRYLSSRPVFGADRGHIHHRLLALGFAPRDAALILYGVCGVAAVLSLLQSVIAERFQGLLLIVFCCLVLLGVKRLGYVEFSTAWKLLSQRAFLRGMQETMYLDRLAASLDAADSLDACWEVICAMCGELQFVSVEMEYDGQSYAGVLQIAEEEPDWAMTLTLGSQGMLRITRHSEIKSPSLMMLALHTVREHLCGRLTPANETASEPEGQLVASSVA